MRSTYQNCKLAFIRMLQSYNTSQVCISIVIQYITYVIRPYYKFMLCRPIYYTFTEFTIIQKKLCNSDGVQIRGKKGFWYNQAASKTIRVSFEHCKVKSFLFPSQVALLHFSSKANACLAVENHLVQLYVSLGPLKAAWGSVRQHAWWSDNHIKLYVESRLVNVIVIVFCIQIMTFQHASVYLPTPG